MLACSVLSNVIIRLRSLADIGLGRVGVKNRVKPKCLSFNFWSCIKQGEWYEKDVRIEFVVIFGFYGRSDRRN